MVEMDKVIYIADDEANIRNLVKSFLERENFEVQCFESGDNLYKAFQKKHCDLIILDIMMPGNDGLTILTMIRQISNVPIIMLTARDTDADYIAGLALGSDDYFKKPVSPMLLVMRVKAIFRRIEMDKQPLLKEMLRFGDIEINMKTKTALNKSREGAEIPLTPNEFNLITYLIENIDRAVSRDELLDKIWGFTTEVETRVADDTVKRIRKKLVDTNIIIDTVWGFGFRLKERAESEE